MQGLIHTRSNAATKAGRVFPVMFRLLMLCIFCKWCYATFSFQLLINSSLCFWFQEDCTTENVWNMGGLSILTSAPLMPPYVCFLCASKGQHEVTTFRFYTYVVLYYTRTFKWKLYHCFSTTCTDAVLPSMLWAFPQVLPWTIRATLWWEQGELVLSSLQVLSRVWQKKQALKGTVQ